jgi:hypothetical protein
VISDQQRKNFLRYFFRRRGIAAHVQREPVNGSLVPLIERGKRRLIPFAKLPQQLLILDWRICHGSSGRCLRSCYPLLELGKSFHLFFCRQKAGSKPRVPMVRRAEQVSVIQRKPVFRFSCAGKPRKARMAQFENLPVYQNHRHLEGRKRARVFISGRVALRDLVFTCQKQRL